jgi:hypothetical protein
MTLWTVLPVTSNLAVQMSASYPSERLSMEWTERGGRCPSPVQVEWIWLDRVRQRDLPGCQRGDLHSGSDDHDWEVYSYSGSGTFEFDLE